MMKKKASDAVEEPVKKTGAAKKTGAKVEKTEKTVKTVKAAVKKSPETAVKEEKAVKAPKTSRSTETAKVLKIDKTEKTGKSVKAETIDKTEVKAKTASKDKKPSAKTTKGHNRPTGKNKESAATKKTAGTAKATAAKETSKTAKTQAKKKIEDKKAAHESETTTVTSSQVENLYGRHYIIDTAQELPKSYGRDRLTVLVRDPEWIYAFWDVSENKIDEIRHIVGEKEFENAKRVLRLVSVDENGKPAESHNDIEVTRTASSWYINVKPNFSYSVELGYKTPAGKFVSAAKSNPVDAPSHKISDVRDEKWMVKDGEFKKLYELSGGSKIGMSSADIMQAMARGMKMEELSELASAGISSAQGLSSEALSSQIMAERSKAEEEKQKQRKFWMVLNTELIVYGATEPDASVTIMGQPIKLREDGTFSIRMALPDTDIDIPVKGISNDRIDEITITPCVHKHTDYDKKENAE